MAAARQGQEQSRKCARIKVGAGSESGSGGMTRGARATMAGASDGDGGAQTLATMLS
jgi:hypothetical protein